MVSLSLTLSLFLFLPHPHPQDLSWFPGRPSPVTSLGWLPQCHPKPSSEHSQACTSAESQCLRHLSNLQDGRLGPESQLCVCICLAGGWGVGGDGGEGSEVESAALWTPHLLSWSEFIFPLFLDRTIDSVHCCPRYPIVLYVGPA